MHFRLTGLLVLMVFCSVFSSTAQPLAAYTNIQNQVVVWDKGIIRKIDYLMPVKLGIGRTAIPYLDNARNFKIYHNGGVQQLNNGFTNDFKVSDNLVAFTNANSLNVFDKGKVTNLSRICESYQMGDSVVLFLDGVRREYKAYYNGNIYPIENFLADTAIYSIKVSDNIGAYVNYANQFRIFYQGNLIPQEEYAITSFDAGRNTVAYVDINRRFRVFHNGKTFTLDEYAPQQYTVGDNVVAFVTNDGYFKIFYNDSVQNIGYFRPDFVIGDNVVAYRDAGGYFKIFYKGDTYTIDSYYPSTFTAQYNSMAYVNRAGTLRLFSEGEIYDVTNVTPGNGWELAYDVLRYTIGPNAFRVFYKGNDY